MATRALDIVFRQAAAFAAAEAGRGAADADLLARFAAGGDQAAFAELVRRHGPLVWSVCRNLLPHDADAEDAFQATFLALVRSAGRVRGGLGAWLHGVAVRVALKARRAAARRRQREKAVAVGEPRGSPPPATEWAELLAAVHEEVARLPAPLRAAFVACGLEGARQQDAADRLGWKLGTLTGRLSRARRRLVERLAARGLSAGAAAAAVGAGAATAVAAVPADLVSTVSNLPVTGPGAVPPAVLDLARGVTDMTLTRTKLIAAALLVAGGLAAGVVPALLSPAVAQDRGGPFPAPPQPAVGRGGGGAAPATAPPGETWEYAFRDKPRSRGELMKVLTEEGKKGWEYGGVVDYDDGPVLVLKRGRRPVIGGGIMSGGAGGVIGGLPPGGLRVPSPDTIFDQLAERTGGKDVIDFARLPADTRAALDRQAERAGLPKYPETGTMTRKEFADRFAKEAEAALNRLAGRGMMGGTPGARGPTTGTAPAAPAAGRGGGEVMSFKLKTARAEELAGLLGKLMGDRGRFVAEPVSNSLLAYADADAMAAVRALIEKIDAPAAGPKK